LSELNLLAGQIEISYWSAGEALPGERIAGKGLFVVRTGALEQRYPDQSLRARLGSGDLFGFSQLEREGDCDYQVIAIEPALIYCIPKPVLYEVMEQNDSLKEIVPPMRCFFLFSRFQSWSIVRWRWYRRKHPSMRPQR